MLYIRGEENVVADYLSRPAGINSLQIESFKFDDLRAQRDIEKEVQTWLNDETNNVKYVQLNGYKVICEMSTDYARPVVPKSYRKNVFNQLHTIGHAGAKGTIALVKARYFWPSMTHDIKNWCRECATCQKQKITRHTSAALKEFPDPVGRFSTVHMDIIGPLNAVIDASSGSSPYRYVVTFIDRFTRWTEAAPLSGISAEEVGNAFVNTWVSRFGVPLELITDRGSQFESALFKHLSSVLGFIKLRTTSFNPKCNGLIERQHRTLKAILRSHKNDWISVLPVALLAMRITPSESTKQSPAFLIYGLAICMPYSCFENTKCEYNKFVEKLAKNLESVQFIPIQWHGPPKVHVPAELQKCEKVWVRVDRVKKPLEAPYAGPFRVIKRCEKFFCAAIPIR